MGDTIDQARMAAYKVLPEYKDALDRLYRELDGLRVKFDAILLDFEPHLRGGIGSIIAGELFADYTSQDMAWHMEDHMGLACGGKVLQVTTKGVTRLISDMYMERIRPIYFAKPLEALKAVGEAVDYLEELRPTIAKELAEDAPDDDPNKVLREELISKLDENDS